MENLIEELTKVNPSNLSEEGLKLFNKINEIIDRNEELEAENKTSKEVINILTNKLEKVVEENKELKQEITVLQNTKDTCPNYPTSGIKCELKIDVLEEE